MNKSGNKKGLIILLFFCVGAVGATVVAYRSIVGGKSRAAGKDIQKFGALLHDKQYADALDSGQTPDEILRAQRARNAGQFSDSNYGKGSLAYVTGSLPGGKGEGEGSAGKDGAGSGAGAAGMSKEQQALANSRKQGFGKGGKSKFEQAGGSKFAGSGGAGSAGGAGAGGQGGSGQRDKWASSSGEGSDASSKKGGLFGRSLRAAARKLGIGGSNSKKGAISDLKNRAKVAYGGVGKGADYGAGAASMAFEGKKGGAALDIGGIRDAGGGIHNADTPKPSDSSAGGGGDLQTEGGETPKQGLAADPTQPVESKDYCKYEFKFNNEKGEVAKGIFLKINVDDDGTASPSPECNLVKAGGSRIEVEQGSYDQGSSFDSRDTTYKPGVGNWIKTLWFFWEVDDVNSDDGSSIFEISYNDKTFAVRVGGTSNGGHAPATCEAEGNESGTCGGWLDTYYADQWNADGFNESLLSKCFAAKNDSEKAAAWEKTRTEGWGYFDYTGANRTSNHGPGACGSECEDGDPSHYGFRQEPSGIKSIGGYESCDQAFINDCKNQFKARQKFVKQESPSAQESECDNVKSKPPCWYAKIRPLTDEQKKNCQDPDKFNPGY